ncbi:MAG: TIR domain-containing protein [Prevotella sp.]|nr:TIR domain-containing protein [Prevotella sp.]
MEQTTYDVFISYSRKDYADKVGNVFENNILSKIKNTLETNGISYWFDEEGIFSGDEFASVLTNAIRNSKLFLFISSANSNQSKWTSNEISTALEFGKTIIPFRIDNSPYNDSVMMKIISFDYIECTNEQKAIKKLLRAINHHITEKNQIESRIIEIPESANGATVIMDIDGKKIEHVLTLDKKTLNPELYNNHSANIRQDLKDDYCSFNPNDISVCVSDKKTPIVLLIGPACVGKTMTLVRLAHYLLGQGYTVQPDRTFRSVMDDATYSKLCDSFQDLINGPYVAPANRINDCILIKTLKSGRNILQIIDMAGEVIMNLGSKTTPSYLYQLLNLENPIIWVIMIEPYWTDMNGRRAFVEKIRELKGQYISSKDKTIIVANKIDKTAFLEGGQRVDSKGLFNQIRMEYPGLLEIFQNINPLVKFFKPYNCTLVPFMSGRYIPRDERLLYFLSPKDFPQILWKKLLK